MKKIFTYSIAAVLVAVLFTSCVKERVYPDNSSWLSQERGDVVYSSNTCGFYVVETNYGYTVVQNLDGLRTYDTDVMYGNFAGIGIRNFYNYTADVITAGNVLAYDLTYHEAQLAIDYYCPVGKANGVKIRESASAMSKIPRSNSVK